MGEEINEYFGKNYQKLLEVSQNYIGIYNYNYYSAEELVSELLIYTLSKDSRIEKLLSLMNATAHTDTYNHNNKAMYYLIGIIYINTKQRRRLGTERNRRDVKLVLKSSLKYTKELYGTETDEPEISDYFFAKDVFRKAKKLAKKNDNWWMYELWQQKYIDKMTYKRIAGNYSFSVTTVYYAVQQYNELIKNELLKDFRSQHQKSLLSQQCP